MSSRCPDRCIARAFCALAVVLAFGHGEARELRVCADPDNMPFSDAERRGFENRIVELIAQARPPVSFDLKITVSAGLVVCPAHGLQADDLILAAEKALLQAKKEGRNRVFAPVEPRRG